MQSLLQSFSWLNKAVQAKDLTISDKAAAIYQDAVDTANNLAKAGDLCGSIYNVLIDYAEKEGEGQLDNTLISALIEAFGTNHEVVLFDFVDDDTANGIHLAYIEDYEIAQHELVDAIGWYSEGAFHPLFLSQANQNYWVVPFQDIVTVYPSGDIDVKIADVTGAQASFATLAANLADAFGVATLVSTVTNSLATGATSLSGVCATVSTAVKALGPTAREMWSDILQNCGQDPESLLNYLMNLYSGFVNASYSTTSNETYDQGYITMDHDTTHFVKSFSSTAVWQIVSTGLQYAGMVLMVAGGAVLKVIGGVVTGAITLINKITEVGSNLDTTATINIKAPNNDFNIPLWWKNWNTAAPFGNNDLKNMVDDLRSVVMHLPMLDVYIWYNEDSEGVRTYQAQAYLRVEKDFNFIPQQSFNGAIQKLYTYDGAHTYTTLRACRMSEHISSDTAFSLAMVDEDLTPQDYTLGWNLADGDSNISKTEIAIMNDERLSLTIANNLALIAILGNAKNDTRTIYTPTFDGNNDLVWSDSDLDKNIGNALHCVNNIHYFSQASWQAIVNYFIPTIQNDSDGIIERYITRYWVQSAELCEDYPDFMLMNSNWIIIQDGYFLVEHPNYTKNAIMLIALASVAILAVGVIAVVVTKKVISNKIRKKMLQKRLQLSKQRQDLNPNDYASVKAYDKATRRYNFLAKICGYPTVDVFNDWVNEDTVSSETSKSSNETLETLGEQNVTLQEQLAELVVQLKALIA